MECIFCSIAKKEIPAEIVDEDNDFIVFKDIHPKAPVHLLLVPKNHLGPINVLTKEDYTLIGKLIIKAKEVAEKIGETGDGYRLIFNVGKNAGMEINHLHLHLLAGKPLKFEF